MAKNSAKNLVNHVTYVIDASGSMSPLTDAVVKLFDNQMKDLAEMSKKNNQETRVSVFTFRTDGWRSAQVECMIYDTDVLRVPSIKRMYVPNGGTPMIQGVIESIRDLRRIPEMFGDHAHIMYVITDGQETENRFGGSKLRAVITALPDNWTIGCLVPDQMCRDLAVNCGFSTENCFIWQQTEKGVEEVNQTMKCTTQAFMAGRSIGQRSMKGGMFKVDLGQIDKKEVQENLKALKLGSYILSDITSKTVNSIPGAKKVEIKPFVEHVLKLQFEKGKSFYALTKTEEIQEYKDICVRDKRNGRIYSGDDARGLIGLPTGKCGTVKMKPEGTGIYEVYVQSTSTNRVLTPGTKFIYFK
ncbi:MAG: VWA domain-containing protein [Eubacteriales bacterium]|nr:VWA domain-containing protein [Eubacteriales bacterium]